MNKYKQDFLESLLGESFFNAVLHNEVKMYLMEQSDKGVSDLETSTEGSYLMLLLGPGKNRISQKSQ